MALLDWIFLIGLLISVVLGLWRGFVTEVFAVLNWLLGLFLAQWLGPDVGGWLPIDSEALAAIAGFVIVFVISVFIGGLFVGRLPGLIAMAGVRPVDRVLGAVFGVLRAAILALTFTALTQPTALSSQYWWRDSYMTDTSVWLLKRLKPVLPQGAAQYLP